MAMQPPVFGGVLSGERPARPTAPPPPAPAVQASKALTPAEIAAHALPAIVTIRTSRSLGTGFVVRADGWIATNLHVVVGGPAGASV